MNTTSTQTREEFQAERKAFYLAYGYKPAGAAAKARIETERKFGKATK